jgi:hypothetical protein
MRLSGRTPRTFDYEILAYFNKVGREIKDGWLEKEAIGSKGIEGLSHVEKNRPCQYVVAGSPSHSFNGAG